MEQPPNRQNQSQQPGQARQYPGQQQDPNQQSYPGQQQYLNQQPYPGQQYPNPQPGFPGQPLKPKRPAWLIPLIVVAVVGVVLSAVLVGVLIGGGMSGRTENVGMTVTLAPSSSASAPEEKPTPVPAPTEAPAEPFSQVPAAGSDDDWHVPGLGEAIDWIEGLPQYNASPAFEPLGCVADFDDDGCQDFLAVYEAIAGNGTYYVAYCVYTLPEDGPKLLTDGVLYQEVGGNGGSLGIAKGKDGSAYLTRFTKEADGSSIHNYYEYIPFWDLGVTENNIYRMESQWDVNTPEQGNYILGGNRVDQEAFDVARGNYMEYYSVNIAVGPGNSDMNGVDFDTLRQWYCD